MKKHSGIENIYFPIIQLVTVQSTTHFNIFNIVLFFSSVHTQFKKSFGSETLRTNCRSTLCLSILRLFFFLNEKGMEEIYVLKNKKNRKESFRR